jgi:hypothetical protein
VKSTSPAAAEVNTGVRLKSGTEWHCPLGVHCRDRCLFTRLELEDGDAYLKTAGIAVRPRALVSRFHSDWQPRSGHLCRRALPRVDQAGTRSWPECHGHPAGLGFRSRLSPRLPDCEARCLQPRIGVATSRGIILTASSTTTINAGRGAGGPSCLRNKEHHAENQPESHDLNYGRPRENVATAM